MATHPVFISYARKTSREHAEALHRALADAGVPSFLDTNDIEPLDQFPAEIVEALLTARVVVVFADETYFTRWYCLREFETALSPFKALVSRNAPDAKKEEALLHFVIAMPEAGASRHVTDRLPSSLGRTQWPHAADTKGLVDAVRRRLDGAPRSIEEDLAGILDKSEAEAIGRRFRERAALPSPANLRGIRLFPTQMPPSLDQGFKGRADDLWRIHHELSTVATGDAPRIVAIEGGGGFGKTRLAREYFHRFGPTWYPGGLFWLDANVSGEELEPRFHGVLRTIKPETPDLKALRDSGKNVRDELAGALQHLPSEASVLFVVDDVPEPGSGGSPRGLEEWCPGAGVVTVLSTSRTTASSQTGNAHALNLDVLPLDAAVDLLTYDNERTALGDAQWRLIAEWVGRLPLALELLQSAIQAGAISPRELFDLANENRGTTHELDQLMAALRTEVPAGALRGITEAFDKSYNLLPENAREAARLLACLAPQPIPLDVLKAMGDEPSSGAARAALVSRSFITPPKAIGGASPSFEIFGQMHKLLADFIRAKSSDSPADFRRAAKALLDIMAPDSCRNPAKWPLMNASLPHAELMFATLLHSLKKDEAELAVDFGLLIGTLQGAQGAADKARKFEEQTLEFPSKCLGAEDPRTLIAMNNLATTLHAQGDFERARKLQEQVLDAHTRIFGGEHSNTLTTMSNLAGLLSAQGDLDRACKLQKQVLDARARIFGGEHPDTLTAMGNLAATLHAQGNREGARELQEQVLEAHARILGGEHLDTLTSMNNLALTLHAQGELVGSRKLQERVLNARTRILGVEHPATLTAMNNLAATLSAQDDVEGARKLQERVLDARTRTLGAEHPNTLTSMGNLAETLWARGDLAGARKLEEQVLDARTRILGDEHPATLTAMNNLAGTLDAQGDLEGACKLQEQALDARARVLGVEHPDTTLSAWNLFSTLRTQRKTERANRILEQNLKWLLERAPETLSHQQRQVRERLEKLLHKPR